MPPGNAEPQLGASHIDQFDSDSDFDFVLFASAVIDDDAIMHVGNVKEMESLLDGTPIRFSHENGIASLSRDLDGFVIGDRGINEAVKLGTSRGYAHCFHE